MSDLQVTVESPGSWARKLSIRVPAERLAVEKDKAARRLASKVRLPGFRKGKVPAKVLEKQFGGAVEQEMLENVMNSAYREAIQQQGLIPISQAEIANVHYHSGEDLTFDVQFEVRPEVELNRIGGFSVTREVPNIDETAVTRVLDRLKEENAVWQPIENGQALVNGDMASIELSMLEGDGANEPRKYQVVLGQQQVRPEIEEVIRTLAPGEEGDFTVELPEGEDGGATKATKIHVNILDAKRPDYPAMDDEFAKNIGSFESLADLKEKIHEDLEKEATADVERTLRQNLVGQILDANPFDVPDAMVNQYLDQLIRPRKGDDAEQIASMKQSVKPQAVQAIRRMMLIERVADMEGLRASEADVEAKIEELAGRFNRPAHEVRSQFQKSGRLSEIEEQITEEKVFDYLKSLSDIN
ncbi:MAG TPA: trigger factor [Longimicrobiales bacterium]|nr:trigger factor [Longimicrobiales bacterium]